MLEALMAESGAGPATPDEAPEADGRVLGAGPGAPTPVLIIGGGRSVPIAAPMPAGSFRASMAINSFAGSYSRSVPRSMSRYASSRLAGDSDSEA
jgi:hypothetical protein